MERSSGIICPVSSLPSPHGIGTLGAAARAWIDWLARADQAWWQVLPVGPTSYGDSPYQSPSTFAGNPYLIDLDELVSSGILTEAEVEEPSWGTEAARVDYGALYEHRMGLLGLACKRAWARDERAVAAFSRAHGSWLRDYALYMSVKRHFGMTAWTQWPDEAIRLHRPEACARYAIELREDIRLHIYIQYLFYRQWKALRTYAHERKIGIIGDLPIYVALDSADVWSDAGSFQLDACGVPTEVAGVPPDAFTDAGQLWGNPLYNYEAMARDGFSWWRRRVAGARCLYDVVRIDHFRGLESYWCVPFGQTTAKGGHWVLGPGMALVSALRESYPDLQFLAEDLGYHSPEVEALLLESGFPGMKLLEFAFDSRDDGDYIPYHFVRNCACYVGTHDNAPVMAWKDEALPDDLAHARAYLGVSDDNDLNWAFIRCGMASVADLFIAQIQDYLGLGAEARINVPGVLGANWCWRLVPGQLTSELADRIAAMTKLYGRTLR